MQYSEITKNRRNRRRVALVLVSAASIIGLALLSSSSAMAGSDSFTISSVNGIYVDHAAGYTYATFSGGNFRNFVPYSSVGLITFSPATGTFHADWVGRLFGENGHAIHDGTYTVDASGHGTMSWISGSGNAKARDFYIVNGGAELKYITTDPPGTIELSTSGTMIKQ